MNEINERACLCPAMIGPHPILSSKFSNLFLVLPRTLFSAHEGTAGRHTSKHGTEGIERQDHAIKLSSLLLTSLYFPKPFLPHPTNPTSQIMTTVDSRTFILNGGYLQKGREKNLRPADLGNKTLNLAPSR